MLISEKEGFPMTKGFRQPDEIISEHLVLRKSFRECDLENYRTHLAQAGEHYRCIDLNSNVMYFTVFLKDTDTMIGYVSITPENDFAQGGIEGYIFKEHRRKFNGTKAFMALIDWYLNLQTDFDEQRNIYAMTAPDDEVSQKFLQHLGFTQTGNGISITTGCDYIMYEFIKGAMFSGETTEYTTEEFLDWLNKMCKE